MVHTPRDSFRAHLTVRRTRRLLKFGYVSRFANLVLVLLLSVFLRLTRGKVNYKVRILQKKRNWMISKENVANILFKKRRYYQKLLSFIIPTVVGGWEASGLLHSGFSRVSMTQRWRSDQQAKSHLSKIILKLFVKRIAQRSKIQVTETLAR